MILDDNNGITKLGRSGRPGVVNHQDKEQYLGRYAGLMLYLKEMDEGVYGKLCAVRHSFVTRYQSAHPVAGLFSAASDMHSTQMNHYEQLPRSGKEGL